MMNCEMCGKEGARVLVNVEGVTLKLCKGCSAYGKIIREISSPVLAVPAKARQKPERAIAAPEETEEEVVNDFSTIIKSAREKKQIRQEDFARMINEKESLIHNIETGRMTPGIQLARKIGAFLGVKLVEEVRIAGQAASASGQKKDMLTLGDIISIKHR